MKFYMNIFISLECIAGIELLDLMVTTLIIWGTARLFFKASVPFYIPTWSVWGFWFHILTNTWNFILAVIVSVQWCLLVVWFVFPWWLMMSSMFSCYWPCIYIYWKNTCSDPFPTLKLGYLSLLLVVRVFCTSPLWDKWFANIFAHSMGCLFYFLDDRIPELLFKHRSRASTTSLIKTKHKKLFF